MEEGTTAARKEVTGPAHSLIHVDLPSLCRLKSMLWVLSMRTILWGSGPSDFLAEREHINSYALLTASNISRPSGFLSG